MSVDITKCSTLAFTVHWARFITGVSDEFQSSPPSRKYNTVKFMLSPPISWNEGLKHEKYEDITRIFGGGVIIFTAQWLKSKLVAAKFSIFGDEYRLFDNPVQDCQHYNQKYPMRTIFHLYFIINYTYLIAKCIVTT